jgi:hypothetical protein
MSVDDMASTVCQALRRGDGQSGRAWQIFFANDVKGCHLTQDTRVQNALDDAASNIWWALEYGGVVRSGRPAVRGLPSWAGQILLDTS